MTNDRKLSTCLFSTHYVESKNPMTLILVDKKLTHADFNPGSSYQERAKIEAFVFFENLYDELINSSYGIM